MRQRLTKEEWVAAKANASAGSYFPPGLRCQTLEELESFAGAHGPAAVQDAIWGAITGWTMSGDAKLRNPTAATTAYCLIRDHDRRRLQLPRLDGREWDDRLAMLSPEAQAEARQVAAETVEDWEAAGRPRLSRSIENTQQYVHACALERRANERTDSDTDPNP